VEGVGVGFVVIEARVGAVPGSAAVQVEAAVDSLKIISPPPVVAPPITLPAATAALPDTAFAPGAAEAVLRSSVHIDAYRFGVPSVCSNGVLVGDGLVLTTYNAIVGADSVVVTLGSGIRVSNSRVASYDIVGDVSVLKMTASTADSLVPGAEAASGQVVWLAGATDCTSAHAQRTRVATRDVGSLQLDETARGWDGAGVVGQHGELMGLSHSGGQSQLASALGENLRRARTNVLTGAVLTLDQVSRRENQSFGTIVLRSDVVGSAARMTPLEKWQPSSAGLTGSIPFTFSGPMGRYRAELLVSGFVRASDTLTVIPGQSNSAVLAPPPVLTPAPATVQQTPPTQSPPGAQAPPQSQPSVHSGGGFPWGVLLLVGAGGGAAIVLLGKKGGGGTTPTGSGSITIHLPKAQ
jgi:hypothetical protein